MNSNNIFMWETPHNSADWDCFRTPILREGSKSTSGGTLCIFGSHTFVPISWMCKKQTSVSHSSTEAEIFSRCRFTDGWNSRSRSLGFGNRSISFLSNSNQQPRRFCAGKLAASQTQQAHPKANRRFNPT